VSVSKQDIISAASSVALNYAAFRQASDLFDVAYTRGDVEFEGAIWNEKRAVEVLSRTYRVLLGELDLLLDCFPHWSREFAARAKEHVLTLVPLTSRKDPTR